MKRLTLLALLTVSFIACDWKELDPIQASLIGTYEVTYLTQYQYDKKVFEGNLPAVLDGTMTIKHGLSIDLSRLKSSDTDAFISYHMVKSWGNYSRTYGCPISENRIRIEAAQGSSGFDFYRDNTIKLGSSDSKVLAFDFVEADSLGRAVRYVYRAKKVEDQPNRY